MSVELEEEFRKQFLAANNNHVYIMYNITNQTLKCLIIIEG